MTLSKETRSPFTFVSLADRICAADKEAGISVLLSSVGIAQTGAGLSSSLPDDSVEALRLRRLPVVDTTWLLCAIHPLPVFVLLIEGANAFRGEHSEAAATNDMQRIVFILCSR
jgi:hypothetical protein